MNTLVRILMSTVAVFATAKLLPGVRVDGLGTALVVAVALGVVSAVLGPLLLFLTLPLNVLTLGMFTFVIIGGLVQFTAWFVPGFAVASFWWALLFALLLSVLNSFLHLLGGLKKT